MNTFSIQRAKLLCSKYFIEHWKKDMMIFAIILIINIFFGFIVRPGSELGASSLSYVMTTLILASNIFYPLKRKDHALNYLMVPASNLEKVTVNIFLIHIYQTLALLVVTVAGLFIGKGIMTIVFPTQLNPLDFNLIFRVFDFDLFIRLIMFQAIFIFGSVYFKKNTFIKTGLLIVGFLFFIILFDIGFVLAFINKDYANISNMSVEIFIDENFNFSIQHSELISNLFCIFYTLIFWVLSFFRLRETEV